MVHRATRMNSSNKEIGILNWDVTESKSPELVPGPKKSALSDSKPLLEAKKIKIHIKQCHTFDETLELEIQCYNLDVRSCV